MPGLITFLIGAVALGLPVALLAQEGSGLHLAFELLLARPYLDERSGEVFDEIGPFRAGPGAGLGIGYGRHRLGATAFAEIAGLEIGPPIERDGMDMGRASALLWSYGLLVHWSPGRRLGGWQPALSMGYVRQRVGSVIVRPDQLPPFAWELATDPDAHPASVAGAGIRLGLALDRPVPGDAFPGRPWVRIRSSGDIVRYRSFSYRGSDRRLPEAGTGFTPGVSVGLLWRY